MLKFALKLDGAASFALGLLTVLVRPEVGMPVGWQIGLGLFCVVYGVLVFALGTRAAPDHRIVLLVIIGNLVWAVDSILTAELKWFPLTDVGVVLVLAQGLAVLGFAVLQFTGLRRAASGTGRGTPPRSRSLA
jgi:drug/metabolite transporter (DMT)-like permease